MGHCFPFCPSRTCKLPGQYLPIWLLKVNWCVIKLQLSSGLHDMRVVDRLLNCVSSINTILMWDVMLCTTVVEKPAVFICR